MAKSKNRTKKESKSRKQRRSNEEDKPAASANNHGLTSSSIFKLDLNFSNDVSLSCDFLNDNEDSYDI